jgi:hypothetical protein
MARGRSSKEGRGAEDDAEAVEANLRSLPDLELLGLLRHASNYTFLARLSDGAVQMLTVYKPARGESPLWDFAAETLYRREVASYLLAKSLGWPRVPPTVIREEAPHGIGALQAFVEADPRRHYFNAGLPGEIWRAVALFDVITNNADRKSGHCLVDHAGEAWVIDHGLTFHTEPKLRTVIWDFAGEPLPDDLRPDLERVCFQVESGELGRQLSRLMTRRESAALRRRLSSTLAAGWTFPQPDSAWSVPWPPI